MGGVLEKFFQISLVLTLVLFGMNAAILAFSGPFLGVDDPAKLALTTSPLTTSNDLNVSDLNTAASNSEPQNVLQQISSLLTIPTFGLENWTAIHEAVIGLGGGYQAALRIVIEGIDPGNQELVVISRMIRTIIFIINVFGLAYIPFALWSTFKGGGAP